jgi:hypothetical protein
MSATLVSSNTTIKVNAAVSATATTGTTIGNQATLYTAPANGYAIVQVRNDSASAACRALVGGRNAIEMAAAEPSADGAAGAVAQVTLYVGPSQSLVVETRSSAAATLVASGVEFVNTP